MDNASNPLGRTRQSAGLLTGHVQPNNQHCDSESPPSRSSPSATVQPFDFPTLNIDGSLDDLSQTPSPRRYPTTPPAALSSLGARARMDVRSESEASFADSQYDMIDVDDLSEISTDDHDTASIASNEDDGHVTPEEEDSDAEEESRQHISIPSSTEASFVAVTSESMTEKDEQMASYLSEDLETPRQSTMPSGFTSTCSRSQSYSKSPLRNVPELEEDTLRLLVVSGQEAALHREALGKVDHICAQVAAAMKSDSSATKTSSRVVRLPVTPSGISLPSATVVCGDSIAATVQHCIGAESPSKLRILDSDGEHSSYYTLPDTVDAKFDLGKPDLGIFYLDETVNDADWIPIAYEALDQTLKVPIIVVQDESFAPHNESMAHRIFARSTFDAQLPVLKYLAFSEKSQSELADLLLELRGQRPPRALSLRSRVGVKRSALSIFDVSLAQIVFALFVAVSPLLFMVLRPASSPAMQLAVRRQALSLALEDVYGPELAKLVNVEHLLPIVKEPCATTDFFGRVSPDCHPKASSQRILPNHIFVSMPGKPKLPKVVSTEVNRDGNRLDFNQTQIIHGVYDVVVPLEQAYGTVVVNMLTVKPHMNITAPYNFGSRMLHLNTYEKATTDVSKIVSKDVAVMRDAATSITQRFTSEIGASAWATRNVTTQLALQMARDLQVIGNTAVAVFGKAAKAGNETATMVTKDFTLLQKDLARFTKDISTTVKSHMDVAKASIKARTQLSRDRLLGLKKAISRRKDEKLGKALSNVGQGCRKLRKALPVMPEHKQAMQKLGSLKKLVAKAERDTSKISRSDLKKLRKAAKKQAKVLEKMQAGDRVP